MSNGMTWCETTAERSRAGRGSWGRARYDDIYFSTPEIGWAINSDGHILHTRDGGRSWTTQYDAPLTPCGDAVWLRCIDFGDEKSGWVGTTTAKTRLLQTKDAGASWSVVENLPDLPKKVCGIHAVDADVVYAAGSNDPSEGAYVLKTTDGGASWTSIDMKPWASNLIDVYFPTRERGWIIGGRTRGEEMNATYSNVFPVVLYTEDGGETWTNQLEDVAEDFTKGSWAWKLQVLEDGVVFVALQNLEQAVVLRSLDGGSTWELKRVPNNANLEGIGFLDRNTGWVGGWGCTTADCAGGLEPGNARGDRGTTSFTRDGGESWEVVTDEVGYFVNRFQFVGSPPVCGYAAGATIYKYTTTPMNVQAVMAVDETQTPEPGGDESKHEIFVGEPVEKPGSVTFKFKVPEGARFASMHVWSRLGHMVFILLCETDPDVPEPGIREVTWDGTNDTSGTQSAPGYYLVRAQIDGVTDSHWCRLHSEKAVKTAVGWREPASHPALHLDD